MSQAKTLSNSELNKALAYIATKKHAARNRLIILLTFNAALRASEVAALRVKHVLNDDRSVCDELRLTAAMVKEGRDGAVPLNKRIQAEIRTYLNTINCTNADAPLFASQKGDAFSAMTMTQLINKLYKDAGIAGATSHSGRRTMITRLANKVPVRVLQKLARHQNIATTQRYIDVNDDMVRKAVELL